MTPGLPVIVEIVPNAGYSRADRRALRRAPAGVEQLTQRQYQIAAMVAQGGALKDVAFRLGIAEESVKTMLSRIVYPRLGVGSQPELVRWWILHVERPGDCARCCLRQAHGYGVTE